MPMVSFFFTVFNGYHISNCVMFLQLSQCQDKMHEMEQQLEDPTQLERIRFLAGEDPTPAQLQGKLEQV